MGHWMTDVNGDDYYVKDKGHWTTDVNGDDHYVEEKDQEMTDVSGENKDYKMTLLYFGNNDCVRVEDSIKDIIATINGGYEWICVKEASTKSTFVVQAKTILYMTDYESWFE